MPRKVDITARKQAKQERSAATVSYLAQAAIYILQEDGPSGFTAQKVADRAGVNIASFYQYFPNKQALLFHLAKQKWEADLARLTPLLEQGGSHAKRLRYFIREFFLTEAEEADLRHALRVASLDLQDVPSYRALAQRGMLLLQNFIREALGHKRQSTRAFDTNFIITLVTSFAERTTDGRVSGAQLVRQADVLTDMITRQFGIK